MTHRDLETAGGAAAANFSDSAVTNGSGERLGFDGTWRFAWPKRDMGRGWEEIVGVAQNSEPHAVGEQERAMRSRFDKKSGRVVVSYRS